MRFWLLSSGFFGGSDAFGSTTGGPFWSIGVTTMKMMSSTSTTSTRGVTLMSERTLSTLTLCIQGFVLLEEEIHELGGGVRHLDLEPLEPRREVVERHDRGDGDEDPERRRDERLGDTLGHRRKTAGAGERDPGERVDDADDRPEQPHEGRRGADRRETAGSLLHLGRGQRDRTVEGPADRAHDVVGVLDLELVVVV